MTHRPSADTLYGDHARAVLAYCLRRVSPSLAHEAVGRVFLTARGREIPRGAEPLLWLLGIAGDVITSPGLTGPSGRLGAPTASAGPRLRSLDGRKQAETAAARLPERDREVLRLAAWEGLSREAIAAVIGCSAGSADLRLARSLDRLVREWRRLGSAADSAQIDATTALDRFRLANPVPDPARLPLRHRTWAEVVAAQRRRPEPEQGKARRPPRALGVLAAFAAVVAAVATAGLGIKTLLDRDEPAAAAGAGESALVSPTPTPPPPTTLQGETTTTQPSAVPVDIVSLSPPGPSTSGQFPVIALGADGLPVVAYLEGDGTGIRITACADARCEGRLGRTIVPLTQWVEAHDLVIGADGVPVLAFVDDVDGAFTVFLARCSDPRCRTHSIRRIAPGHSASLALDGDGNPMLLYRDELEQSAVLVRCSDPVCGDPAESRPLEGAQWRLGPVAFNPTQGPLVVEVIVRGGGVNALRATACGDDRCESTVTSDLADIPADATVAGVAVDGDGLPTIFVSDSGQELLAVRCLDVSCTLFEGPVSVGGRHPMGAGVGVLSTGDRFVLAAAGDTASSAGWLFSCDDATCATGTAARIPEMVGWSADLTAGGDGSPIVVFHTPGQGARLLACTSADCEEAGAAVSTWTPETAAASQDGGLPEMPGWQRAAVVAGEGGGFLQAVSASVDRLVAGGTECRFEDGEQRCEPMIWSTAGPGPWTPAATPPALADGSEVRGGAITGVAAGGPGFVAVGSVCSEAGCRLGAWNSSDGDDWVSAVAPPEAACGAAAQCEQAVLRVVAGPTTLVAVGSLPSGISVWWSGDGAVWRPGELPRLEGPVWLEDVIAMPGGLLAWGGRCTETANLQCSAILLTSPDGREWTEVSFGTAFSDGLLHDVVATDGGYHAAGRICDEQWNCRAALWQSADGRRWSAAAGPDAFEGVEDAILVEELPDPPGHLLVVGSTFEEDGDGDRCVFLTGPGDDDAGWERLAGADTVFPGGRVCVNELTLHRSGGAAVLIAVGGDRLGPAVWILPGG